MSDREKKEGDREEEGTEQLVIDRYVTPPASSVPCIYIKTEHERLRPSTN